MKMAYLIIWYLKYVSLSFIISAWPPRPFSCFGFVCQWVWGLWTWRGMPAPQLSVGSATPHLWKEGAACGYNARTVSVTATRTFCALHGAFRFTPHFVFICLCDTLNATYCTSGKHDHYDYSRSSRKLNIFYYSRWNERHVLFYVSCGLQVETSSVSVAAWRYETPQQVQFVEKLSDVVIGQLPNFWKLWISYVNGSLFSEVNIWGAFTRHWHHLEVDTVHLFISFIYLHLIKNTQHHPLYTSGQCQTINRRTSWENLLARLGLIYSSLIKSPLLTNSTCH